jgi:Domain of unknown function (DUF4190)
MDNQTNSQPSASLRKGLAIAALVIGIVSILTCGGLLVGPITGITLGLVALKKIKRDPAHYAGKRLAIAGIVTSACSLFILYRVNYCSHCNTESLKVSAGGARDGRPYRSANHRRTTSPLLSHRGQGKVC